MPVRMTGPVMGQFIVRGKMLNRSVFDNEHLAPHRLNCARKVAMRRNQCRGGVAARGERIPIQVNEVTSSAAGVD